MVRQTTFPADDLEDRTEEILGVLRRHDPVPVPTTVLYLSVRDKRHLADAFEGMVRQGLMEKRRVAPGEAHFAEASSLAGLDAAAAAAPIGVYQLTETGRSRGA